MTALLLLTLGTSCSSLDPDRTLSRHYYDGRYHNLAADDEIAGKGFGTVLYWQLFGPEDPPAVADMVAAAQPPRTIKLNRHDFLAPPDSVRLIWIGHATVWLAAEKNGKRVHIVTDPIFGSVPLRSRLTDLPLPPEEWPGVDAVVVSHAHLDHLDKDSLLRIQAAHPSVQFFFAHGMRVWAADLGLRNVHVLSWWDSKAVGGATIRLLPAHHWTRLGLFDTMQYHWGSYAIEAAGKRVYFAGDTGFSSHFAAIAARFPDGFDAALMPIGAFKPRWFMRPAHIDPAEALRAGRIIGARRVLPIHWGTLRLGDDLPSESALHFADLIPKTNPAGSLWQPGSIVDLKNAPRLTKF